MRQVNNARSLSRGLFVTGTDTGVGKTLVSCALMHSYARRGCSVVGMKPIAAGVRPGVADGINDDVRALCAASTVAAPMSLVNPYCFESAIAPHIAAQMAGVEIDIPIMVRAYRQLAQMAQMVIVEGAGGFRVPLGRAHDMSDLCHALGLSVVLVVGLRLGCINHALLTAQAVRARGATLAGWVANHIDPAMAMVSENVSTLVERLHAPLLGEIVFMSHPSSLEAAAALDLSLL